MLWPNLGDCEGRDERYRKKEEKKGTQTRWLPSQEMYPSTPFFLGSHKINDASQLREKQQHFVCNFSMVFDLMLKNFVFKLFSTICHLLPCFVFSVHQTDQTVISPVNKSTTLTIQILLQKAAISAIFLFLSRVMTIAFGVSLSGFKSRRSPHSFYDPTQLAIGKCNIRPNQTGRKRKTHFISGYIV